MGTEIATETNGLERQSIPLLPLRDVVVFPHTVIPLFIGRKSSVHAITHAMEADKHIFLVTQKDEAIDEPKMKIFTRLALWRQSCSCLNCLMEL